ncbi:TPR-like protein [Basidiobolus meristosporus CBS 931.73]|uniref:TPR-like protein n=1 Tax=Basidiobolus meristosporus CBS 931.73 TaxID=1314790 RepID=A0A1Y1YTP2_9FUNG|nr:TPR-like protein [Basidiobolus meristosporus CBS 931.73]|eukprot:ORY01097.1 TPR-like protein [Basidiobolus meristosporus CBS 931.73]
MSLAQQEWAILLGNELPNAQEPLDILVNHLIKGNFKDVLTSQGAQLFFGTNSPLEQLGENVHFLENGDLAAYITARADQYMKEQMEDSSLGAKKQLELLCYGIACLNSFVQAGWTGPKLSIEAHEILPVDCRGKLPEFKQAALRALSSDSEDVYHLAPQPLYLWYAVTLLAKVGRNHFTNLSSAEWWAYRALFIQQKILDNGSATLHDEIYALLDAIENRLPTEGASLNAKLLARYRIEQGIVCHYYHHDRKAFDRFTQAQEITGLKWELTGALGKRTKFQTFDVSQLVLLAKSAEEENHAPGNAPETLALNDDTLLESIELTNPEENQGKQGNLRVIDQCILLSLCLNVKNSNPANGITNEQMVPYVTRVLENPNNWMVHTMGLLLRSRLESNKSRTVERSALQLQALVDQFSLEESSVTERLAYFYTIDLPSKWEMEKELAERFMSLGVIRSALEIFERLETWEEVIQCYALLEKVEKAEAIIRERLAIEPNSPKLHCILGDLRKEPSHWEQAWEISGGRYARAQRSLGSYYFQKNQFAKSMKAYQNALTINPLFENSWFICGCAAMQIEEWDVAIQAFTRCVSLDNENGEAWNNLASVYLRQQKKLEAYQALQQGLRLKFDSWKIWTNYMYVCVDIGSFSEAIRAFERVVDLRWEKDRESCVDVEVLRIIISACTRDVSDFFNQPVSKLANRIEGLLMETITSRITQNPSIWNIVADFFFWKGDYVKCLDCHIKAYRAVLHQQSIEIDEKVFTSVAEAAIEMVDWYRNLGSKPVCVPVNAGDSTEDGVVPKKRIDEVVCKDWKYQAKMLLRSLIGRTRDMFEGTAAHDRLVEELKELNSE